MRRRRHVGRRLVARCFLCRLQLRVSRLQLRVGRLQLRMGRLQLRVCRLQLRVSRLQPRQLLAPGVAAAPAARSATGHRRMVPAGCPAIWNEIQS